HAAIRSGAGQLSPGGARDLQSADSRGPGGVEHRGRVDLPIRGAGQGVVALLDSLERIAVRARSGGAGCALAGRDRAATAAQRGFAREHEPGHLPERGAAGIRSQRSQTNPGGSNFDGSVAIDSQKKWASPKQATGPDPWQPPRLPGEKMPEIGPHGNPPNAGLRFLETPL